jgi:hypothetical protein
VFDAPYSPAIEGPDRRALPWHQADLGPEVRAAIHLHVIDGRGTTRALKLVTVSPMFTDRLETLHAKALTKGTRTRPEWDQEIARFNVRYPTPIAAFRKALVTCWGGECKRHPTSERSGEPLRKPKDMVEHLMANPHIFEFVLVDEGEGRVADVGPFIIRLLRANGGFLEPNELRASNFLERGLGETRSVGAEIDALYGLGGMYDAAGRRRART